MQISPIIKIVAKISSIIALFEWAIMTMIAFLPFKLGELNEVILDVTLLATLSTPIIYYWIIKPYVVAHNEVLAEMLHLAGHDSLTQLPNRRLLIDHFKKIVARLIRYKFYGAALYIDLDGFKAINDKFGHDAGDFTLMEVAKRLSLFVRSEDIVSRIGGDEFFIVLSQLDHNEEEAQKKALIISERILAELSKSIDYQGIALGIGSSIGVCYLKPEEVDIDIVLRDADNAMYKAKEQGKGCVVVS